MDAENLLADALRRHQAGDLKGADALYGTLLEQDPQNYDALRLRGVLAMQQGRVNEAESALRRAVSAHPDVADAWVNLATLHQVRGELDAAAEALERALSAEPRLAPAHNNLGNLYLQSGRLEEAIAAYRKALEYGPDESTTLVNMAGALDALGRTGEALQHAERGAEIDPELGEAHATLAALLDGAGRHEEAVAAWERALSISPDEPEWHYGHGLSLAALKRWDDACVEQRRVLAVDKDNGAALSELMFNARRVADWSDRDVQLAQYRALHLGGTDTLSPFITLYEPCDAAEQLAVARRWSERIRREVSGHPACRRFDYASNSGDRVTVGYLSSGLQAHATGTLTAGIFEHHDNERFRTIAYSLGEDDGSVLRRRIVDAFDRFRDVRGWHWSRVAEQIHEDGVDILVDVNGYAGGGLPETLVPRPAPIQVNWLAYPGSMGAPFIDYVVVDDVVAPEADAVHYSEAMVTLPGCYQPTDDRRPIAEATPTRVECGLPEDGVVLCCFNNSYKIGPDAFDAWMAVLRDVEDAVLWLLDLNPASSFSSNLRAEAAARKVDPERLVFMPKLGHEDYLARYRLADLFLDTWPYNAHTTASDALWAGCPVLTVRGDTFASRVAASILEAADLADLITDSPESFTTKAIALARDRATLEGLRDRTASARESRLFDTAAYTRVWERALEAMWARYRDGRSPAAITIEG